MKSVTKLTLDTFRSERNVLYPKRNPGDVVIFRYGSSVIYIALAFEASRTLVLHTKGIDWVRLDDSWVSL